MSAYEGFLKEKVDFEKSFGFSNPGELVYDPFGGLFTVPLRAMKMGRRGRAAELNSGYFLDGVKYLQAEERKRDMPSLFDLDDAAAVA